MTRSVGGLVVVAAMLVAASAMSDAPQAPLAKASSGSHESCPLGPTPCCPAACQVGETVAADEGNR